jgi:hypothetical protein
MWQKCDQDSDWSPGSRTAEQSRGKHHDPAQQPQHAVHGNAQNSERDQQDPHQRVYDQYQEGQRPAQHEQDAPDQEFPHV